MGKALRIHFWMLGQDLRFGLPERWGLRRCGDLYERGPLRLHRLGLSLRLERGWLLYLRQDSRFYRCGQEPALPSLAPPGPPWKAHEAAPYLRPLLLDYETFVAEQMGASYRAQLRRLCPPLLRAYRTHWDRLVAHSG